MTSNKDIEARNKELKEKFDTQPWFKAKKGYPSEDISRVVKDMDRNIVALGGIEAGLDHMPVHSSLKNLFYTAMITIYLEVKLRSNPDEDKFFKASVFQTWKDIILNMKILMELAQKIITHRKDIQLKAAQEELAAFNEAMASVPDTITSLPKEEDDTPEDKKKKKVFKPSEMN